MDKVQKHESFNLRVSVAEMESVLRSQQSRNSRNSPPFMEPEGSSPFPQKPATGLYPEPNVSISHFPTLFP
jgi:hypothetical protein